VPDTDTNRFALPYRILSGEDADERACSAIPDEACSALPRNYVLNVANGAATKLAEQLASPGLVLPWLIAAIGAPAALAGLLLPLKQVGALLPQLAIAGWIRSLAVRKWVWVIAAMSQAVMLTLLVASALWLQPTLAGWAILGLFLVFSALSGVGSIAFQDVVGKTIPRGRRGRLLAKRAVIGGALTLAAAILLRVGIEVPEQLQLLLPLILCAALLWATAALLFALIAESAGATQGGRSMLRELERGLVLTRAAPGYRRYLLARSLLLLGIEIAMPFYALHAATRFGANSGNLALFVFAIGLASIVSSPLWGAKADVSSERVMALAGATGVLAAVIAIAIGAWPAVAANAWWYSLVFLLLGIAEAGVRLGRKTYLVDGAPAAERPHYVAFGNTVVGAVAIAGGALGLLAASAGPTTVITVMGILAALGAIASLRLPEASQLSAARGSAAVR